MPTKSGREVVANRALARDMRLMARRLLWTPATAWVISHDAAVRHRATVREEEAAIDLSRSNLSHRLADHAGRRERSRSMIAEAAIASFPVTRR